MIGAVQIASAAEALTLGEKAGLDPKEMVEALGYGQVASRRSYGLRSGWLNPITSIP
jgi:3-hydroxyisobutyrate dehydrogenase-like beta-hydroxyacid dehydrogenase